MRISRAFNIALVTCVLAASVLTGCGPGSNSAGADAAPSGNGGGGAVGAAGGNGAGGATGSAGTGGATGAAGGSTGSGGSNRQDGGADSGAVGGRGNGGAPDAGSNSAGGQTGQAGNSGNTGAGGNPAYSPCPALPAPCKLLPFGDSITFGVGSADINSNGGYRVQLFHRANLDHKTITFVGTAAPNGPTTVDGVTFPRAHEGHSGYTIDDKPVTTTPARSGISPLAATVLAATRPDVVLLMIGTNDIQIPYDAANAPTRLAALIDAILAFDAHTLLVVAQIIPTGDPVVNPAIEIYNAAIASLVAQRAAAGKHILTVDMYHVIASAPGFTTAGRALPTNAVGPMFDWLHPNVAGYVLLGDTWYDGLKAALH